MNAFLDFLLILIFVVIPAAAICTQVLAMRLPDVTFRDTSPKVTWAIVHDYAMGTFEQRFGYPTGYFFPDDKRSQEGVRLLMREMQPAGAITDGCSMQIGSLGAAGLDDGCGAGCLWFCMIGCIGAPFFAVSFLDRFFRRVLRSRVDVRFALSGTDTIVSFAFYGPGGYVLRRRYAQAFAKPELPESLAMPPTRLATREQPSGGLA
ncbi:MAG TPA: hypothetical protein VG164_11535 [Trebonia sp.]|jgi:hypothetical protein|nr:hypothetical protein [Trebonia sp.]